jgi:hypothetical protein
VLAALAALICGFSLLRGIDPFDEGLILQAADRIADGQLPYRDYLYPYGPGQPFLLAGLQELFGPSLLVWRIVRLLVDVAVSLVVFEVVRREAPMPIALLAWLTAATAMAQPLSANPFPLALLFALVAVAVATSETASPRYAALAGLLTGAAAAWRLDFGAYAAAACIAAVVLRPGDRRGRLLAYAGTLGAAAVLVYLPFFAAAGPDDAWEDLVAKSLRERESWTLPFPFSYDGSFGSLSELKDVLDFYVPLILVVGTGVAAAIAVARGVRERVPPWRWAGWVVLAIGFAQYLLSRTDPFHETPLRVALAVALAVSGAWALRLPAGRARLATAGVTLALLVLIASAGTANRLSALFSPPDLEPVDLAIADGVDAEPIEARALPQAVRRVQELVPPGEPIHVVTRRSDLVRIGNPLFPYLAERPTVLDSDFDLLTSADAQRDVVATLKEEQPLAVVRWNHPTTVRREDNLRGEPSGSRLLDEYLEREYEVDSRFGWYEILVPR